MCAKRSRSRNCATFASQSAACFSLHARNSIQRKWIARRKAQYDSNNHKSLSSTACGMCSDNRSLAARLKRSSAAQVHEFWVACPERRKLANLGATFNRRSRPVHRHHAAGRTFQALVLQLLGPCDANMVLHLDDTYKCSTSSDVVQAGKNSFCTEPPAGTPGLTLAPGRRRFFGMACYVL